MQTLQAPTKRPAEPHRKDKAGGSSVCTENNVSTGVYNQEDTLTSVPCPVKPHRSHRTAPWS
jgi:hypothetical protein